MKTSKKDIAYKVITDQIIEMLKQGEIPWEKPWISRANCNLRSKHVYKGINRLMTAAVAAKNGWVSPYWVTFNQVRELGGKVKKGSKATYVVLWKFIKKEQTDGTEKVIPLCRYYKIFNVEQTEGLEAYIPEDETFEWDSEEKAEEMVSGCKFSDIISYGGSQACYIPSHDRIEIPCRETFKTANGFYATTFHEMVHATGHITRLDRKLGMFGDFGSHEYSKEELVAELGASFLCAAAGITNEKQLTNAAAYCQSWIKVLQNDVHAIVSAASKAEKAAKYIMGESVDAEDDQLSE